jgi:hypothetical protein
MNRGRFAVVCSGRKRSAETGHVFDGLQGQFAMPAHAGTQAFPGETLHVEAYRESLYLKIHRLPRFGQTHVAYRR